MRRCVALVAVLSAIIDAAIIDLSEDAALAVAAALAAPTILVPANSAGSTLQDCPWRAKPENNHWTLTLSGQRRLVCKINCANLGQAKA